MQTHKKVYQSIKIKFNIQLIDFDLVFNAEIAINTNTFFLLRKVILELLFKPNMQKWPKYNEFDIKL